MAKTDKVTNKDKERDFTLIRKIRRGDKQAFNTLLELHEVRLRQILTYFGLKEHEVDEAYQQVSIKIWYNLKKFKFESSIITWYYRICHNLVMDIKRKANRNKTVSIEDLNRGGIDGPSTGEYTESYFDLSNISRTDGQMTPSDKAEISDQSKQSVSAMEFILTSLSQKHSQVLRMYVIEEMTYKQIAKILNCSIGTVMSRIYYARGCAKNVYKSFKLK